jgi:rare lipoprotein A
MKNRHLHYLFIIICCLGLAACGGNQTSKPRSPSTSRPAPPVASKPAVKPQVASGGATSPTANSSGAKPGGYYLDDGPGDNPPQNIDSIPNAMPKKEILLSRANRPYKALGTTYTPNTSYQPYKERGVASWYGKRYHGKKTSSGEVYDMYTMSAAHTTLPLPSYVKVTNPANGRAVVVRVNDRGPFKSNRIIDLSYAAAYKLRFSSQGSTLVEVEAIDPDSAASYVMPAETIAAKPAPATITKVSSAPVAAPSKPASGNDPFASGYFVQAGAFKNELNANALLAKIQGLEISQNAGINNVYNNGLYRIKLGPYTSKSEADQVAASIRKQLNTSTIVSTQ